MRLLEYWRREAEEQRKAYKETASGKSPRAAVLREEWTPPDEETAEAMFHAMPRSGPMQIGMNPDVSRMPEELREMVRWAEKMKTEKGMIN